MVAAAWAIPLAASYAGGIDGVDSMWYHLPQSAVFVQTGSVTDLHFTDPYFLNWYYPAHSELLHAVPMLAFDRDWLSPSSTTPSSPWVCSRPGASAAPGASARRP